MASIVPAGKLVYGMQLQVQAKSKTFVEDWEADAGADELRQMVQRADANGFFYVAVCDHLAVTKPMDAHMQTTWYETVATLGWIAALTTNVRVMSHVYVLSYRHPLHTAKSFMTLDELSGGRAILGVGAGHLQGEFELLGLDYDARGKVTDAAIDVDPRRVRRRVPRRRHAVLGTHPRRRPRAAARASTRCRSGWAARRSPRCAAPPSAATAGCRRARPAPTCPRRYAFLLEHRKRTLGDEPIDLGTITEFLYVGDPGWDVGEQTLSGKPDYLAERLNEFAGMGVSHLQIRFRNRSLQELLDQMDAFGRDVAPLLSR